MDQTALIHETDWDYLIILDACRFDYFKNQYEDHLPASTVEEAVSPVDPTQNYATSSWLRQTFTESYNNTAYISATPRANSSVTVDGFTASDHFDHIADLWDTAWDEEIGAVSPDAVNDAARSIVPDHGQVVLHYIQPHFPYLSVDWSHPTKWTPEKLRSWQWRLRTMIAPHIRYILGPARTRYLLDTVGFPPRNHMDALVREQGEDDLKSAYQDNLDIVLSAVSNLLPTLEGTTIITSDHGELLGENGYYGHSFVPRHSGVTHVPWMEIES